jgi:hypothetical protein
MKISKLGLLAIATLAFTLTAVPALAAETASDTTVNLPWGQYVAEAIVALGAVAAGLVGHLTGLLPGPARWAVQLTKLDQVAAKAISAAAFDLAEDIRAQGYSVDVRNAMLAKALRVFEANAASLYAKYQATIALKLKARIEDYIADKSTSQ